MLCRCGWWKQQQQRMFWYESDLINKLSRWSDPWREYPPVQYNRFKVRKSSQQTTNIDGFYDQIPSFHSSLYSHERGEESNIILLLVIWLNLMMWSFIYLGCGQRGGMTNQLLLYRMAIPDYSITGRRLLQLITGQFVIRSKQPPQNSMEWIP